MNDRGHDQCVGVHKIFLDAVHVIPNHAFSVRIICFGISANEAISAVFNVVFH